MKKHILFKHETAQFSVLSAIHTSCSTLGFLSCGSSRHCNDEKRLESFACAADLPRVSHDCISELLAALAAGSLLLVGLLLLEMLLSATNTCTHHALSSPSQASKL
jgi:hypothetical protein